MEEENKKKISTDEDIHKKSKLSIQMIQRKYKLKKSVISTTTFSF